MKTVFLEMEKIKDLNSGLGQFCLNFGRAICELNTSSFTPYFHVPSQKIGIFGESYKYKQVNKIHQLSPIKEKFDIWHCLHQGCKYLPPKNTSKIILTIHDLNFLEEKKGFFKERYKLKKLQRKIDRADFITVISKYTEAIVRESLSIDNTPIKVIYNGNTLTSFANISKPAFAPKGNFFFSMGIISPKKNFATLIPILKNFKDFSLIIGGNKNHPYAEEIRSIAKKLNVSDRVIMPGIISNEEKYWLYNNCHAFLFPSIAEGFGLPVVEAMSVGKPVFLSKSTSLPEIGGKEAFYFNSFESDDMIATMERGLNDWESDQDRGNRAIEWSKQFSWKQSAESYQDLYLKLQ